jgi:hypothetical protein
MQDSKIWKKHIINLSETLDENGSRSSVARVYFKSKVKELTVDVDKQIETLCGNYINQLYTTILGDNWKKIVEKYNVEKHSVYMLGEENKYIKESISNKYFPSNLAGAGYSIIRYSTTNEYPMIENLNVMVEFSKSSQKKKLISLLCKKIKIEDDFVTQMCNRGIIGGYRYLPGINTFQDLSIKFPDVFETWVFEKLKKVDQVEVVVEEDEIKYLKSFLGC